METEKKTISIAIDGYSKCGKSNLAKKIAKKYGILYIDSGSLYRFVTYISLSKNIKIESDLDFLYSIDYLNDGTIIYDNHHYGDEELGCDAVNNDVSVIAQIGAVRLAINKWIRHKSQNTSVVMDGRDIGTVVLPFADVKVFLLSSIDYRMKQWQKLQLNRYGHIDIEEEEKEKLKLINRDFHDLHRAVAPLKCAEDATVFNVEEIELGDIYSFVCAKIDSILKS